MADSGAQVDIIGEDQLAPLGMATRDLLPTRVSLDCANNTKAKVLGVFLGKIWGKSVVTGKTVMVRGMVYVIRGKACLMSKTTLRALGCLPEDFPEVGRFLRNNGNSAAANSIGGADQVNQDPLRQAEGECDPDPDAPPCRCPRRQFQEPPEQLPFPATASNREVLEGWIKDYYAASAFNGCKRQSWPKVAGPPMKIFTKADAVPVCVRKPAPVPLHWRKEVQDGIKADIKKGVLERVPYGTPDTWCTRMIIQAKKNGKPRRTIDLSALTKASIRDTHHTRSPAKVARTVPAGKLKSTLDCIDGYHGVEIAEEDRHKTTFITEEGKFRYKRIPQGYGSSGDGYTRRTDDILASCPNTPDKQDYEKIIDDIIIWNDSLEECFFRVCNILSHCNKSGMVFSKDKFEFAKQEVEFAGITIGKDGIKPTDKYLTTIANFPTPTNIHEIRSWFGLINQVNYCFATSAVMAPFRHLLSPKNEFKWDDSLERAFVASKKEIVRLIEAGVKAFDPELTTCLSPDYSKTGMGWILQQKTCKCMPVSPICCKSGWRLVLAGGRFCSGAESRYSVSEGEATACKEGLRDTKYYTLGCKDLYIATDHLPLVGILGDRALDTIDNPRMMRIKEKTLRWQYKIIYVPGLKQEAADAISRRQTPKLLHKVSVSGVSAMDNEDMAAADMEEILVTINSLNTAQQLSVITWDKIHNETQEDRVLVKLIEQVEQGFPESQHKMSEELKEYHKHRHNLHVVDGVVCYKGRLIIPTSLRKEMLAAIHSAHQGVTGMNNRVEQSVFWPGISVDIINSRHTCGTCIREAPSQPAGVPVQPPSPDYPFQMIVGDYFSVQGNNYLVIGDRYSGWLHIYKAGVGEFDGQTLEAVLREHSMTFNIPEEFSSDGGPQMMSEAVQSCLRRWGVRHRLSSSYFPHSNCRAELAVKTGKRLLRENMGIKGSLNTDKFMRAVMQYRNTPIPDLRLSPAQIVFGRQIRDFLPVLPYKYRPSQEWTLLREDRERALATRREHDGTRLARYTKHHPPLPVGTHVAVQNQTGRNKTKWDKTGVILENKPHSQVLVRMDGSRRMTLRNRKFVKQIIPPQQTAGLPIPRHLPSHPQHTDGVSDPYDVPDAIREQQAPQVAPDLVDDVQQDHQQPAEIPAITPGGEVADNEAAVPSSPPPPTPTPAPSSPPSPMPDQPAKERPRRERKQNSMYSSDIYDLSQVGLTGHQGCSDGCATSRWFRPWED